MVCFSNVFYTYMYTQLNIQPFLQALGDWTDFSKIASLIIVERFLVRCSEDSIPRSEA